jgi:hypothetical protein
MSRLMMEVWSCHKQAIHETFHDVPKLQLSLDLGSAPFRRRTDAV